MKLSISKYAVNRKTVADWFITRPNPNLPKEASNLALATGCPIIIVVEYMMDHFGRTEELLALQKKLCDWYKDEVIE